MLRVRTEFQAQVKETEGSIQSLISCVTYVSHQSHSPSLSVSVKQRAWIRSEFPTHFKTNTPSKVHSLTKLSPLQRHLVIGVIVEENTLLSLILLTATALYT